MRNILSSGFILLLLVYLTSCSKPSATHSSNTWSFKGTSYSAVTVATSGNAIEGSNLAGNAIGFTFYGSSVPTASGTYTIINNTPTSANQVGISLTNNGGGTNYYSSGVSGALTATVTVTGGKVSISVPSAVTLVNFDTPSDSSTSFTATISQP